jgi:hypothetical protein
MHSSGKCKTSLVKHGLIEKNKKSQDTLASDQVFAFSCASGHLSTAASDKDAAFCDAASSRRQILLAAASRESGHWARMAATSVEGRAPYT